MAGTSACIFVLLHCVGGHCMYDCAGPHELHVRGLQGLQKKAFSQEVRLLACSQKGPVRVVILA
jgi:hypothetical protein